MKVPKRLVMKPGLGWRCVGGAVYDHSSGLRLHLLGLCRLPSGEIVNGGDADQYRLQNRLIRINGGNRKRGLMAWAINILEHNKQIGAMPVIERGGE